MEDRDWLILQVLYEQKNITKTAQALFISQPALTARLQQIEKEFSIKIVHRTTKGVHFTPQGEYLAKSASEVLHDLRKLKEQVINVSDRVAGTLRLGASGYLTMYTLPPLLKRFRKQYPDVEFKLTTTWSKDVFNLVYNQEVHIGFISSDYGWQDQKHELFTEPIYIASMDAINPHDLPKLPRIDYRSDLLIKTMIDKWWRENYTQPPTISMEVDKLETCKEMVRHGLGYGIMPSRMFKDIQNLHKIMLIDKEGNPLLRKASMIYYETSLEIKAMKAFVNFVEQIDFRIL